MKKIYLAAALCWLATLSFAQVRTRSLKPETVKEYSRFVPTSKKALSTVQLPKVNVSQLLKEDEKEASLGLPFRFGKALDVKINLANSGKWETVDGGRIWRMLIDVPEAKTVNMIFDRFYLPEGATMFIINGDRTVVSGPIDHTQNSLAGTFSSGLLKGSSVIIELFEPAEFFAKTELQISKVVHGYRLTPMAGGFGQAAPDPCERNVNCAEGNNWQNEKGMVAMVLLNNNERICSGSLLNNTCNNMTPNFLTAFHCLDLNEDGAAGGDEIAAAQTWHFMFQYMSAGCTPSTDDFNVVEFAGATYRAGWNISDFALLELNQTPEPGTGVVYAGWSRTNAAPTSSVGIHHPKGDVMKISVENNVATSVDWNGVGPNTHWGVNFETGTVERGSSGSPLFNQNHRVVGQLHGGRLTGGDYEGRCINRDARYGRFDVSWVGGGTNDTRLSNWLDPSGSGATDVGPLTIPSISGPSVLCTSGTYTLNNVPGGVPVSWSVSTPSGVTPTSGSGNVANLTMINPEDVTITYRIGCNATRGITRRIYVGPPQFSGFLVNGQSTSNGSGCTNSYIPIAAVPNDPSANYYWSQSDPNGFIANATQSSTAFTGYNASCYYLNVNISNACGSRNETLTMCLNNCFAKYSVFPNPAKDYITVEFGQIESAESLPDEIVLLSEKSTTPVENIDVQTLYQRNGLKNGKQVEIDAKALPRGTYYLHIKNSRLQEKKVDVVRILLD
ncbi:trypsin-like peptidase domain-containing protein [Dyadobacter jiangsuensis]|uniref:Trypsin-like peptidase n=1 Tax=Dyadobacter jiangsuensis TaxID=1591085 RepID=A0A2P8FQ73_9BACT|nr:trypsin-like peptidase domain-containing protein [Dyadobacter jiangsuensis]PSL23864.1 trypsin-like peptidase [Dyadobacter jiangsuensis]